VPSNRARTPRRGWRPSPRASARLVWRASDPLMDPLDPRDRRRGRDWQFGTASGSRSRADCARSRRLPRLEPLRLRAPGDVRRRESEVPRTRCARMGDACRGRSPSDSARRGRSTAAATARPSTASARPRATRPRTSRCCCTTGSTCRRCPTSTPSTRAAPGAWSAGRAARHQSRRCRVFFLVAADGEFRRRQGDIATQVAIETQVFSEDVPIVEGSTRRRRRSTWRAGPRPGRPLLDRLPAPVRGAVGVVSPLARRRLVPRTGVLGLGRRLALTDVVGWG
jgi:hypothetical protein